MLSRIYARQRVFEAFLFVALIVTAVAGLASSNARAHSVTMTIPVWSQYIYYAVELGGGVLGLLGLSRDNLLTGLLIERAALIVVAGSVLAFGIAILGFGHLAGLPSFVLLAGFSAACVTRIFQIRSELVAIQRVTISGQQ